MKTPIRRNYTDYPGRFVTSNDPYLLDLSDLPEDGETITAAAVTVMRGDTIADRVAVDGNVVTFWLSGGSRTSQIHQFRVDFTSSMNETDSVLVTITVLG